ncbi:alpha/beta hydrolase [Phycicoccus ginsengisoli]
MTSTDTAPQTRTLEVPGATLHYDVRPAAHPSHRTLVLGGHPMAAHGFGTLASFFPDRTVVTYDPRGTGRNPLSAGAGRPTWHDHGNDLAALVAEVSDGPQEGQVDFFGSSGGAVIGLALVAAHPALLGTLVAHEPPFTPVLPDRASLDAAGQDIHDTYHRGGHGPAMAKFLALITHEGPLPEDWTSRPAPEPAAFGLSSQDDGRRDDALLGRSLRPFPDTHWPDLEAVAGAGTRVVLGVGEESGAQMARRAAEAVAARVGVTPVVFPSHHGGFAGNEYGMPGQPEAFAATLREVLDRA